MLLPLSPNTLQPHRTGSRGALLPTLTENSNQTYEKKLTTHRRR